MVGFHSFDMVFRRYPRRLRRQHDGGSMGIIGANIDALMAPRALETNPDVGLHLFEHMTEMQRGIGIGKCRGNQYLPSVSCHRNHQVVCRGRGVYRIKH